MVQVVTNLHAIFCTFWVCLRMLDHLYYYSEERVRIAVSWLTGLPAVRLIQNQGNSAIAWSITMRDMTMMKVKSQRSTKFWITTRFSLLYCEKKLLKKSSIWSNLGSSKEENTGDQGCIYFWLGFRSSASLTPQFWPAQAVLGRRTNQRQRNSVSIRLGVKSPCLYTVYRQNWWLKS